MPPNVPATYIFLVAPIALAIGLVTWFVIREHLDARREQRRTAPTPRRSAAERLGSTGSRAHMAETPRMRPTQPAHRHAAGIDESWRRDDEVYASDDGIDLLATAATTMLVMESFTPEPVEQCRFEDTPSYESTSSDSSTSDCSFDSSPSSDY